MPQPSILIAKPKILERQTGWIGYLTVERLRVLLADGSEVWREVERHGDAAVVLPYDCERRCVLVAHLFRAPVFDANAAPWLEEACAGMIEDKDAKTAARREAMEELGVRLGVLEFVARVWPSPGVSTERYSLFLAPYRSTDRIDDGGGVTGEHEGITVVERSLASCAADVDDGIIEDSKLLTLLLALRWRHPELFNRDHPVAAARVLE